MTPTDTSTDTTVQLGCRSTTKQGLKYPEFISFVRQYGGGAYLGTNEELDREIDWFLAYRRMFLLRSRGRLLGMSAFLLLESPQQLYEGWPEDRPGGKYLWVPYIVLHPVMRGRGTMSMMVKSVKQWFPLLEYMLYFRLPDPKRVRVVRINAFIAKGV